MVNVIDAHSACSGVAFATLAACLGVILGRPVAQKIEWKETKKGRFCEVCHGRSELPVRCRLVFCIVTSSAYVLPRRSTDIVILLWWMSSTLTVHAVAWRLPHWPPVWGSFSAGQLLKKLNGKRQKKGRFCEVCHGRSELPVRPW